VRARVSAAAQRGTAGPRALARRLLDQDPPETRFRRCAFGFPPDWGEASDSRNFEIPLDIGPKISPRAVLGDQEYDTKANRQAARRRGVCPAIPYRDNAAAKPNFFPKNLYKGRARAEQGVGKIKRFKRIALRCEKAA
jgi:hypothetical protein